MVVGIIFQDFLLCFQLLTVSAALGTKTTVVVRDLSKTRSCWEMERLGCIVVADLRVEIMEKEDVLGIFLQIAVYGLQLDQRGDSPQQWQSAFLNRERSVRENCFLFMFLCFD